jgi:hypothetical protein
MNVPVFTRPQAVVGLILVVLAVPLTIVPIFRPEGLRPNPAPLVFLAAWAVWVWAGYSVRRAQSAVRPSPAA